MQMHANGCKWMQMHANGGKWGQIASLASGSPRPNQLISLIYSFTADAADQLIDETASQ